MNNNYLSLPFYVKLACICIGILSLGYLAYLGQTILVPFILGTLFSLLLIPFCNFLERKLSFPRTIAALVAVILFFGLGFFSIYLLGTQLSALQQDWPAFQEQLNTTFITLQDWVDKTCGINSKEQIKMLNETAAKSIDTGTAIVGVAIMSLSSILILVVFTILYTFFMLIYRGHMVKFFLLLNKQEHHPIVMDIIYQIQYVVKKYLTGLLIQMLLVAVLTYILLLCTGVKYSILLAIITGIINVLPYVGIVVAILIIALITFATSSLTNLLIVSVGLIVIHMIDSNFIVPKIVGSKVKVNSLFAMLAIILGEMIWGISGMFLAIPILAIAKIIFDRINDLKAWGYLLGDEEEIPATKQIIKRLSKMGRKAEVKELNLDMNKDDSNKIE